ncbi:peptidylprolyl isomerase [Palleronia sp. KMU-117]|uniref:peptidylprolyl isomerase n=1 Tax=Palleronia sp. KMU-117 TaxID=3434108 RepID=UPI003D75444F
MRRMLELTRGHPVRGLLPAVLLILAMATGSATAQNPFETVFRVNGSPITRYELQQRTLFLTLLNAGANPGQIAEQQLVNERLQRQAAERDGVTISDEQIAAAQGAFAAQGQFDRETFIAALGEQGVEEATFRDFVATGVLWRAAVSQRFLPRAEVTEDEIDRALAQVPSRGGVRVLLSEIILPAQNPESETASLARAERLSRITDELEFAAAARQFSAAPSRLMGGEINWRALDELPPEVQSALQGLAPGRATRPINLGGSIAVFRLRDREEVRAGSIEIVSADYAEYLIPGGRSPEALSRAAAIKAEVRTCDDLNGVARGQPEGVLTRRITRIAELPGDVAREIAGLDQYEVSTNLTRGGNLVFLMLCERTVRESTAVDRAQVRQLLTAQRLETFASGWLNELRLAARIEDLR